MRYSPILTWLVDKTPITQEDLAEVITDIIQEINPADMVDVTAYYKDECAPEWDRPKVFEAVLDTLNSRDGKEGEEV